MNEQMNIYRSFEQWKNGNVLEHGVPRIEYYSEAQLDLVEMGWNYGYDAGRAVEQALDKKADNARELGLSYDPEHDTVDIADIIAGELKVSRGTAYDMMREALKEASPAEPVASYCCHSCFKLDGGFMLDRMILCPECGNKRCPKASDHKLDCTGSNEPNQPGSVYTAPQPVPVQEPVAIVVAAEYEDGSTAGHRLEWRGRNEANDFPEGTAFYTAPQPVPVKTYHDGKPWPVQPVPHECQTEAEKTAYAFGWWKAMEYVREHGVIK
jgi:DNA-directed RNA polymerase subunit RPC12/RpoP